MTPPGPVLGLPLFLAICAGLAPPAASAGGSIDAVGPWTQRLPMPSRAAVAEEDVRLTGPTLAQATARPVAVTGLQDGRPVVFSPDAQEQIAGLAVELLQSADYEAGRTIATEQRWSEARHASHLHLSFTPARAVTFRFSTTGPAAQHQVEVAEMLIAISPHAWPGYLLIRERGRVRAFSKYRPRPAQALQDALRLR